MSKMNQKVFEKMVKTVGAPADCRSLQALTAFVRANILHERTSALMEELGACGRLWASQEVRLPGFTPLLDFGEFGVGAGAHILGSYHFGGEDTLFSGDLTVSGELVSAGRQVIAGNLTISGDLTVAGDLTVYGRVTVSGRVTGPGRLDALGGLVTPGPLEVQEVFLSKTSWIGGGITTPRLIVKGELGTAGSPSDWV